MKGREVGEGVAAKVLNQDKIVLKQSDESLERGGGRLLRPHTQQRRDESAGHHAAAFTSQHRLAKMQSHRQKPRPTTPPPGATVVNADASGVAAMCHDSCDQGRRT